MAGDPPGFEKLSELDKLNLPVLIAQAQQLVAQQMVLRTRNATVSLGLAAANLAVAALILAAGVGILGMHWNIAAIVSLAAAACFVAAVLVDEEDAEIGPDLLSLDTNQGQAQVTYQIYSQLIYAILINDEAPWRRRCYNLGLIVTAVLIILCLVLFWIAPDGFARGWWILTLRVSISARTG